VGAANIARVLAWKILYRGIGVFSVGFILGVPPSALEAALISLIGVSGRFTVGLYRFVGMILRAGLWTLITYILLGVDPLTAVKIGIGGWFLGTVLELI
jgi:hypothetical protein